MLAVGRKPSGAARYDVLTRPDGLRRAAKWDRTACADTAKGVQMSSLIWMKMRLASCVRNRFGPGFHFSDRLVMTYCEP